MNEEKVLLNEAELFLIRIIVGIGAVGIFIGAVAVANWVYPSAKKECSTPYLSILSKKGVFFEVKSEWPPSYIEENKDSPTWDIAAWNGDKSLNVVLLSQPSLCTALDETVKKINHYESNKEK